LSSPTWSASNFLLTPSFLRTGCAGFFKSVAVLGSGDVVPSCTGPCLNASLAWLLSPALKFPVFAEDGSTKGLSDDHV
jgi:hypothetical protein